MTLHLHSTLECMAGSSVMLSCPSSRAGRLLPGRDDHCDHSCECGGLGRPNVRTLAVSNQHCGASFKGSFCVRAPLYSMKQTISRRHFLRTPRADLKVQSTDSPEQGATFGTLNGEPSPLGVSNLRNGLNFALFSQNATSVTLCLFFDPSETVKPSLAIDLDPNYNRTGNIWHISVEGIPLGSVLYGYRVDGPAGWEKGHRFDSSKVLIDPYAQLVQGRRAFGDVSQKTVPFLGLHDLTAASFDWGHDYKLPAIPEQDLIIYEMNVRAFTSDESSAVYSDYRGSYLGVIEKIPYLLELGINAVELLPVHEFDELEFQRFKNPRDHMINTWGYSTINFFAPMSRYGSKGGGCTKASTEFKEMVKALHKAGIEIILDVVYNHTNEAGDKRPYLTSYRGIDNLVYYIVDVERESQLSNYSGCGLVNTTSMASALTSPVLFVEAIAKDPVLARCKIIAEPWDCGGLYQVGSFPNWDRWAEWNGKYRDDVRKFIKGDPGMKGAFATRLAGSADLYNIQDRRPYHSINFIVAHDGFTLYDLVSYNSKHNQANGEDGRDGSNDNFSWNCGIEGNTNDTAVNALRERQIRNFQLALMLSQGTPMILMGDEYGHTRFGNNNTYGHDSEINNFQWEKLANQKGSLFRFFSEAIKFRRQHPLLGRDSFLTEKDVTWHEDHWDDYNSRFLAFTLLNTNEDQEGHGALYAAFNMHTYFVNVVLPQPPSGKSWYRVADTNLPPPADFVAEGIAGLQDKYNVAPFSSILLMAKSSI